MRKNLSKLLGVKRVVLAYWSDGHQCDLDQLAHREQDAPYNQLQSRTTGGENHFEPKET